MDEHEAIMDHQAAKERISIWKGAQSRKIYFPKHLRRESNGAGLDGFRKRVKKVHKDMTFEDAYLKYRPGNIFRESRETNKDIEVLLNKVSRKPRRTLKRNKILGSF